MPMRIYMLYLEGLGSHSEQISGTKVLRLGRVINDIDPTRGGHLEIVSVSRDNKKA